MAAHGKKTWPPMGSFSGRQWGASHGHRQASEPSRLGILPVLRRVVSVQRWGRETLRSVRSAMGYRDERVSWVVREVPRC